MRKLLLSCPLSSARQASADAKLTIIKLTGNTSLPWLPITFIWCFSLANCKQHHLNSDDRAFFSYRLNHIHLSLETFFSGSSLWMGPKLVEHISLPDFFAVGFDKSSALCSTGCSLPSYGVKPIAPSRAPQPGYLIALILLTFHYFSSALFPPKLQYLPFFLCSGVGPCGQVI